MQGAGALKDYVQSKCLMKIAPIWFILSISAQYTVTHRLYITFWDFNPGECLRYTNKTLVQGAGALKDYVQSKCLMKIAPIWFILSISAQYTVTHRLYITFWDFNPGECHP